MSIFILIALIIGLILSGGWTFIAFSNVTESNPDEGGFPIIMLLISIVLDVIFIVAMIFQSIVIYNT